MKKYIYIFCCFLFFACKDKEEQLNAETLDTFSSIALKTIQCRYLKILIHGLPEDNTILNKIAARYGFQYYSVGGCVVSKHLRDSAITENIKTDLILNKKFGNKWRCRFETVFEKVMRGD